MKLKIVLAILAIGMLVSCGGEDNKQPEQTKTVKKAAVKKSPEKKEIKKENKQEIIDLNNKGIGPVKSIVLSDNIDQETVNNGQQIFINKCAACHRIDRKFIGPNPTGILKRRSPEWIMNMIMNPTEMVAKDPIAKELLAEFNGAPMADQNISKEEASAILEYFRTLK